MLRSENTATLVTAARRILTVTSTARTLYTVCRVVIYCVTTVAG